MLPECRIRPLQNQHGASVVEMIVLRYERRRPASLNAWTSA
jgi:hypothetical protein